MWRMCGALYIGCWDDIVFSIGFEPEWRLCWSHESPGVYVWDFQIGPLCICRWQ